MKTVKTVTKDIKDMGEIRGLLEVFEEMAASKMQKIRKSVVSSKEYFEGLARISEDVALDITDNGLRNGKKAALFLSADAGLFGDIVEKILVDFVDYAQKQKADAFVLGTLGKNLLKVYAPRFKFESFNFPIDGYQIDDVNLKFVLQRLSQYEKVSIFHGQFLTIATQKATFSNMSGGSIADLGYSFDKDEAAKIRIKNIYEPSIGVVGEKFAKEISVSIFSQSVQENQLAKYAARLIHLDSALENIDQKLGLFNQERSRMRKKAEQKRQVERISRMVSLKKVFI